MKRFEIPWLKLICIVSLSSGLLTCIYFREVLGYIMETIGQG